MALKTLLVIPSGRSKIWHKDTHVDGSSQVRAKDAYIGRFSQRCALYARTFYPDDWCILSPHYGFILPDEEIGNYDTVRFGEPGPDLETIEINAGADGLLEYERVIFLGNWEQYREYIDVVNKIFSLRWVEFPLMGAANPEEMIGKLVDAVTRGSPLRHNTIMLSAIDLRGLFGYFDHNISLCTGDKLSIITAPNGYGKTTILRLLRAVFVGNVREISSINFESLSLTFLMGGGGSAGLEIRRTGKKHVGASGSINFIRSGPGDRSAEYTVDAGDYDEDEVSRELSRIIPPVPVKFISAQRLWQDADAGPEGGDLLVQYDRNREGAYELAVLNYSEDVIRRIRAMLTDYAASSQDLDSTFPGRYVKLLADPDSHSLMTTAEIADKLESLHLKRQVLEDLGFLYYRYRNPAEILLAADKIPDELNSRAVLSLYIADTEKKFQVFEDLKKKIELIQSIMNDLFLHMDLRITADNGFNLIFHEEESVLPENLSSGEQNQLVMYYDLIFRSDPGTLVLIDEPEISLHIVWQRQFLSYIRRIIDLTGSDFIIATHSPQLIHVNWDNTVDLAGGEPDEK